MAGKEKKISELCEDAYQAHTKGRGSTTAEHPTIVAFVKAAMDVLQRDGGEEQLTVLLDQYKRSLWKQAARLFITKAAQPIDCVAGVLFNFQYSQPTRCHDSLNECVDYNALKSIKALLEFKDAHWDLKCLKEAYEAKRATAEAKALIVEAIPLCQGICSVHRRCGLEEVQEIETKLVAGIRVGGFLDTQERDVAEIKACREWAAAVHKSSKCANLPATPPLAAAEPLPKT